MATPHVVQSPPLRGRACGTSTQDYSNYDSYSKTLRKYCRSHNDHHLNDGNISDILDNGHCHASGHNWCVFCESRFRDRKPVCLGRRRCRSESTERDHGMYFKVMQDACEKSYSPVKEYNLRSGSSYNERSRNKISRKDNIQDYFDHSGSSRSGACSSFNDRKHPHAPNSCLRNGSVRQLLGSCENYVELSNRNMYFSRKCDTDKRHSSDGWTRDDSASVSFMRDDRYNQEMYALRHKLHELKKSSKSRKKHSSEKHVDLRNDSAQAYDHFSQEIEILKTKFDELKDATDDGKRESDFDKHCEDDSSIKRARDKSPHNKTIIATMDQPVNPAVLVSRMPTSNIPFTNSEAPSTLSSPSDVEIADSSCDVIVSGSREVLTPQTRAVEKSIVVQEPVGEQPTISVLSISSSHSISRDQLEAVILEQKRVVGERKERRIQSSPERKVTLSERKFFTPEFKPSSSERKLPTADRRCGPTPERTLSAPHRPVTPATLPPKLPPDVTPLLHSKSEIKHAGDLILQGILRKRQYAGLHPGLRASLFSFVPPFINFATYEERSIALPVQIQSLMKWRMSKITPVVVRKIIVNTGYKLVRRSNEWCGTWGKHMKSICFKTLRDFQKMNHFPGTFQIGRKDNLWKNLLRFMTKFGKKEFGFMPRTYVLPQDNKLLRAAWEKHCGRERWIVKPPASARGSGIKVIYKWSQIPKKCPLIVQRYISDPFLINGSKFDLRLYALITSVNPLRVYLYDNGLVRFASVKYSSDLSTLVDRYMHLTNYSINKLSSQYTQNEDAGACQGHKWTLKALWVYLEKEKGVDVKKLWAHMVDLVIKTMISGESSITQLSEENLCSRYCSYELFGVDILLDQNLKPWLLEVNISPSLHSSTPLDMAVKAPMVRDLMNLAGYQIPNKLSTAQQESLHFSLGAQESFCFDNRLYTTVLSPDEHHKHIEYEMLTSRYEYLNNILEMLTPDDVRHLIQYEDELTQKGHFQKIFPTAYTHHYLQFFESPRYYNMLFDAWETRYHKDRDKGIQLLEGLCKKQVHLHVSNVQSTKASMSPTQVEEVPGVQERDVPQNNQDLSHVETKKEHQQWTLSATALCRAARTRGSKPGLVTKPYPRSSYITHRSAKSTHEKLLKTKS